MSMTWQCLVVGLTVSELAAILSQFCNSLGKMCFIVWLLNLPIQLWIKDLYVNGMQICGVGGWGEDFCFCTNFSLSKIILMTKYVKTIKAGTINYIWFEYIFYGIENNTHVVFMILLEGKKMFYLIMKSHIYIWLYGIGHIVKNHSDNKRGNLLVPLH